MKKNCVVGLRNEQVSSVSYLQVLIMKSGVDDWDTVHHINETICTLSMEEQLNPWSKEILDNVRVPHQVMKYAALYKPARLIRARHLSLL
jgi:hypothetical protein